MTGRGGPPSTTPAPRPGGTGVLPTGAVVRRRAVDEVLELPATQVLGLHAHGEADRIHEVGLACRAEVGARGVAEAHRRPRTRPSQTPSPNPGYSSVPAPFGPTTAEKSKKGPSVVLPP